VTQKNYDVTPRQHFLPIYLIEIASILIGTILVLLVFSPWPKMLFGEYEREIKTSAAGSGMLLILLSIVRIAERVLSGQEHSNLVSQLRHVTDSIEGLKTGIGISIQHLREELKGTTTNRVIFASSLKRQVAHELSLIPEESPITMDVAGFTLYAFYQDYLRRLEGRANTTIRMLIQDPNQPTFDLLARQEARDPQALRDQAKALITEWTRFQQASSSKKRKACIEVRLYPLIATVTGNRINSTWFTRSRVLHEASNPGYFFERYVEDDKEVFACIQDHFNRMWDAAREPTQGDNG